MAAAVVEMVGVADGGWSGRIGWCGRGG